jgi:guanylate kinase
VILYPPDSRDTAELKEHLQHLRTEPSPPLREATLEILRRFQRGARATSHHEKYGYCFDSKEQHIAFRTLVARSLSEVCPSPRILVIAGGSGSGKTTLTTMLLGGHPNAFAWLRRTTTRPLRSKDADEINMHRFMDEAEFAQNRKYIYGATHPYGFSYGFLLEDIISAILATRIWVVNALVQHTDLKNTFPGMQVRTVGISPVGPAAITSEARQEIARIIKDRIKKRDDGLHGEELSARVTKACQDAAFIHQAADHIVANKPGIDLNNTYAAFESVCLSNWTI